MTYFSKGLAFGAALTLGLSACMAPNTSLLPVSPGLFRGAETSAGAHQFVRFRVELPLGFRTQQMATAQYAKLEIWNKYTLAALAGSVGAQQVEPLHAEGADANGFVPVNGGQFVLGADVPEGSNWLATVRLYSNNNEQSEIQQLKVAFHVPSTSDVIINHRTTVAARVLEALQITNSPLVLRHTPGQYPSVSQPSADLCFIQGQATQCQIPINLTNLQAFADALTEPDSNPVASFPETLPSENNPELQLPLSNNLVRFTRIENELNPPSDECLGLPEAGGSCEALPPPVSLADIDFYKIADNLSDGVVQPDYSISGSTLQLSANSAQNANLSDYRYPLFLAGQKKLAQRDSTGGTLALNPVNQRLFIHNRVLDVNMRDGRETIQSIELLPDGQFGEMAARNDLQRIDSAYPVLGKSNSQDTVFLVSRAYGAGTIDLEGNVAGQITLYALDQQSLSEIWSYRFEEPESEHACACHTGSAGQPIDANRTRFAPVLEREGTDDIIYTALNAINDQRVHKGIYKIKNGELIGFAPLYRRNALGGGGGTPLEEDGSTVTTSQTNFTSGGALSLKSYQDPIRDIDGEDTGELTNPSKRLFALLGAGNNEDIPPELMVVDVDHTNQLDAMPEFHKQGNLRRLRFPLQTEPGDPAPPMLHENSSPVVATLPDGTEIVYFSAYTHYQQGINFYSRGYLYAYNPTEQALTRVFTTEPQISVTGQTNDPPTIAYLNGLPQIYLANGYGQLHSLSPTGAWSDPVQLNWKTQVGRMAPPLMLFGSPDIVKRTDGSLTLYIASSTVDGRVYELDPLTGLLRSQMFPGGFFSAGSAVHNGYMYITTRSGNYGDFTSVRSLKIDAQGLANDPADAAWPKAGGGNANNGNGNE